jgi:hypothetical protein
MQSQVLLVFGSEEPLAAFPMTVSEGFINKPLKISLVRAIHNGAVRFRRVALMDWSASLNELVDILKFKVLQNRLDQRLDKRTKIDFNSLYPLDEYFGDIVRKERSDSPRRHLPVGFAI